MFLRAAQSSGDGRCKPLLFHLSLPSPRKSVNTPAPKELALPHEGASHRLCVASRLAMAQSWSLRKGNMRHGYAPAAGHCLYPATTTA